MFRCYNHTDYAASLTHVLELCEAGILHAVLELCLERT
jgi:hypothetical protein